MDGVRESHATAPSILSKPALKQTRPARRVRMMRLSPEPSLAFLYPVGRCRGLRMTKTGRSRADFVRRNVPFMVAGLLVCGLLGYFIGGPDGRAMGGGIGVALGLAVGGLIGKLRDPAG